MNEHQPETPLPWSVANTSAVIGADGKPAARHADSVYTAHAANAYPKLVGAMHGFLSATAQARNIGKLKGGELAAEADARRLLRDIGESIA